jgi:hypothetical protein
MTTVPPIIDQAEGLVRELAAELTRVRPGECLCCYVARQLDEYPCDGTHRHAYRFRDTSAPRASALRDRLSRVGACCCDCELFLNGYQLHSRFSTPVLRVVNDDDDDEDDEVAALPAPLPPCAGVRRGSVQPCGNWARIRPGW